MELGAFVASFDMVENTDCYVNYDARDTPYSKPLEDGYKIVIV